MASPQPSPGAPTLTTNGSSARTERDDSWLWFNSIDLSDLESIGCPNAGLWYRGMQKKRPGLPRWPVRIFGSPPLQAGVDVIASEKDAIKQMLLFSSLVNNIRFLEPGTREFVSEVRDQLRHHLDPSQVGQSRAPFGAHARDHRLAPRLVMLALNAGDLVPLVDAALDRYNAVCFCAASWVDIFKIKRHFILREADLSAQPEHQEVVEILETSKAVDMLFPNIPGSALDEPWTQSSYEARGRTEAATQLRDDLDSIMKAVRFGGKTPTQIVDEIFGPAVEDIVSTSPDAPETPRDHPAEMPIESTESGQAAAESTGKNKRKRGKKGKKKGKTQAVGPAALDSELPTGAAEAGEAEDEAASGHDPSNRYAVLAASSKTATTSAAVGKKPIENPATNLSTLQQAKKAKATTSVDCPEPRSAVVETPPAVEAPTFSADDFPPLGQVKKHESENLGGEGMSPMAPKSSSTETAEQVDDRGSETPAAPPATVGHEAPTVAERAETPMQPPPAERVSEPGRLPFAVPARPDVMRRKCPSESNIDAYDDAMSSGRLSNSAEQSLCSAEDEYGTEQDQLEYECLLPISSAEPQDVVVVGHPPLPGTLFDEYVRGWLAGFECGRRVGGNIRVYNTSHRGRGQSKSI